MIYKFYKIDIREVLSITLLKNLYVYKIFSSFYMYRFFFYLL
nr:MAG TPA: hypothetical protein [Caudoviricetes sp.]